MLDLSIYRIISRVRPIRDQLWPDFDRVLATRGTLETRTWEIHPGHILGAHSGIHFARLATAQYQPHRLHRHGRIRRGTLAYLFLSFSCALAPLASAAASTVRVGCVGPRTAPRRFCLQLRPRVGHGLPKSAQFGEASNRAAQMLQAKFSNINRGSWTFGITR